MNTRSNVAVAPLVLLGQPFWQSILDTISSKASLSFSDGDISPQKLFPAFYGGTYGVSLIIVNLLKTPLIGTNCLECDGSGWNNLGMVLQSCPGILDTAKSKAYSVHQIPGMMPYPNPSRHGNGDPDNPASWLGAIGLYNFFSNNIANADCDLCGGIAFATDKAGSDKLLGITFRQAKNDEINFPFQVCADLSVHQQATAEDNLQSLSNTVQHEYSRNGTIAIGARLMTAPATPKVILVWVEEDPGPGEGGGFGPGSLVGGGEGEGGEGEGGDGEGGDGSGHGDPFGDPEDPTDPFGL